MIRLMTGNGVRVGVERGRLDRSFIPAVPYLRCRIAHLRAVTGETMNIFSAAVTGQSSSMTSFASLRPARWVSAALASTMNTSRREAVPYTAPLHNRRPLLISRSHAIHEATTLDIPTSWTPGSGIFRALPWQILKRRRNDRNL